MGIRYDQQNKAYHYEPSNLVVWINLSNCIRQTSTQNHTQTSNVDHKHARSFARSNYLFCLWIKIWPFYPSICLPDPFIWKGNGIRSCHLLLFSFSFQFKPPSYSFKPNFRFSKIELFFLFVFYLNWNSFYQKEKTNCKSMKIYETNTNHIKNLESDGHYTL